ncbi:right-handed parallel beta-helix repeat-containing protein [Patescibacteria group bacterium]
MTIFKGQKLIKLLIVFGVSIFVFFLFKYIYNSKFVYEIDNLEIPKVPALLEDFMMVQIPTLDKLPCADADFQWFDYYDPELKTKVEVKRSGLCTLHYDSLANHSIRLKYGKNDLRLKAAASELAGDVSPFGLFNNMFSEYSIYHILKPYTKYIPGASLVQINGDESDIRILWEDEFDNSVREEERVDWKAMAKIYKFSKEKFDEYFWVTWKTKNVSEDNLDAKFSSLLKPIFEYVDKPLTSGIETDFDEEEYLKHLALVTVIGSTHFVDNNLLFVADTSKSGETKWSPVIYDPGALHFSNDPIFSVFRFNYITEFFMRNPKNVYEYLGYLNEYTENIMGKKKVSKFYERFECSQVKRVKTFGDILLQANHKLYPTNDINGFCNSVDDFKQYDTKIYQRMRTRINASSLRWNFYDKAGEKDPVLIMWSHTAIPSKLKGIRCGNVDCTKSFELLNEPWWDLPKDIISPKYVRSNGTVGGYKSISTPYYYIYRWKELEALDIESIKVVSENAITGEYQESVKAIYPVVNVHSQLLEDPKNHYLFELEILGPINSDYSLTEAKKDNWGVNIQSSACQVVQKEGVKFVFDCSGIALDQWPYPFDYTISLYYKNAKIRDEYGEMFVDVQVPQTYPALSMENISSLEDNEYSVDEYVTEGPVGKVYVIPADTSFEITDDLMLKDSTLVIEEGSTLEIWPMVDIKVGNIITLGNLENNPVTLKTKEGLPGWGGIEITNSAYIQGTTFDSSVDIENGALYGDNVKSLYVANSKFTNNKTNITCSNCNVELENVEFIGGIWGLKASNSYVEADTVTCGATTFCFDIEDNVQNVSNLTLIDLKAWGFNILGPSTDLTINNIVSAIQVPAIYAHRGYPSITTNFNEEGFQKVGLTEVRIDDPSIYSNLVNNNLEDLKKEYVNVIEQDKNNPQVFYLKKSEVMLSKDLVMPKGTELIIDAGTKVNLGKKVSILSYGKVSVLGTEKDKVVFKSSDKNDKSWGVLAVKGTDAEVFIQNAVFENAGDNYLVGFNYTGAVTADHAKSLIVKDSEFRSNTGDDAVNCKYTNCLVENNLFVNNLFDGVDFDFAVEGSEIKGNTFENNGNDGIDVSFDKSFIYNNKVIKSGDKCISVGEGSQSSIINNELDSCKIGIEVKDGSNVSVYKNIIKNNSVGVNAYMKKRRFLSGGTANVYECSFENNIKESEQDEYSEITIDNETPSNIVSKFDKYFQ